MSRIPGKIVVKEFAFINDYSTDRATRIDAWPLIEGMSLYENVFMHTMSGVAKVLDSYNLYSTLPITSNTYVKITLQDPTTGESVYGLYRIYKVSAIEQESPKVQTYMIHFASSELFLSRMVRVSKHVLGNIPTAARDIHNQISAKPINIDADATKTDLYIPFRPGLEAIDFLAKNAKWKATVPDYAYWETLHGFNFRSLSSCMIQNQEHDFATSTPMSGNIANTFNYSDYIKIDEIEVKQTFDEAEMLYDGYSGTTVYTYDPLAGLSYVHQLGADPLSYTKTISANFLDYESISKRAILFNQIRDSRYYIQVPGLLSRSAGDVANVTVYNGNNMNIKDTTLSGKRLILGIAHVISRDEYTQNITLGDYYLGN